MDCTHEELRAIARLLPFQECCFVHFSAQLSPNEVLAAVYQLADGSEVGVFVRTNEEFEVLESGLFSGEYICRLGVYAVPLH
jgi:hypothetical protein